MNAPTAATLNALRCRAELIVAAHAVGDFTPGELDKMNSLEVADGLLARFHPVNRDGVVAATNLVARCLVDAQEMGSSAYALVINAPQQYALQAILAGVHEHMEADAAAQIESDVRALFVAEYGSGDPARERARG